MLINVNVLMSENKPNNDLLTERHFYQGIKKVSNATASFLELVHFLDLIGNEED